MKSYDQAILDQLAAGAIRKRLAILFDLPSGQYGFVLGVRGSLSVNGALYVGAGSLIGIERPAEALGLANEDLIVTLASHYLVDGAYHQVFEPHLLDSIENEIWFKRPAVLYRFWFDAGRRMIGDPEQLARREIYRIEHVKADAGKIIRATLGSPAALARDIEGRINGPELQAAIDATDRGYDYVASAATETIYWGRLPPGPANSR